MNTNNTKVWYKSKTIWFNILSVVLMVVSNLLPELQAFINIDSEIYAGIMAVVNIGLRFITSKGVTGTSK